MLIVGKTAVIVAFLLYAILIATALAHLTLSMKYLSLLRDSLRGKSLPLHRKSLASEAKDP